MSAGTVVPSCRDCRRFVQRNGTWECSRYSWCKGGRTAAGGGWRRPDAALGVAPEFVPSAATRTAYERRRIQGHR
jgi:hypothetical protein